MAKERADELARQAREIIEKERARTKEGAQSALDEIRAWEKECGDFLVVLGPNAKKDIPKEQQKKINLAAKDLTIERRFNIFMREVYQRKEMFEREMNDPQVNPDKERAKLKSDLERYEEFIKRFEGSNGALEFQTRCPEEAREMIRKMNRLVSGLRSRLLTKLAFQEFYKRLFNDMEQLNEKSSILDPESREFYAEIAALYEKLNQISQSIEERVSKAVEDEKSLLGPMEETLNTISDILKDKKIAREDKKNALELAGLESENKVGERLKSIEGKRKQLKKFSSDQIEQFKKECTLLRTDLLEKLLPRATKNNGLKILETIKQLDAMKDNAKVTTSKALLERFKGTLKENVPASIRRGSISEPTKEDEPSRKSTVSTPGSNKSKG